MVGLNLFICRKHAWVLIHVHGKNVELDILVTVINDIRKKKLKEKVKMRACNSCISCMWACIEKQMPKELLFFLFKKKEEEERKRRIKYVYAKIKDRERCLTID